MLLDIEVAGNVGVIHVHGEVDVVEGPRLSDAAEKVLHEGGTASSSIATTSGSWTPAACGRC